MLALADILPDYKASLHDAASVFKGTQADPDADFKRHLAIAARALGIDGKRSSTRMATLTLIADQSDYTDVPADLVRPKVSDWGSGNLPLWDRPPGPLPVLCLVSDSAGAPLLVLTPPPTSAQIAAYGSAYRFYYLAAPVITDATSTVRDSDRDLVLLRAMVEAAREMVNRNLHKPVQLSPGSGSFPSNQTPAAWFSTLMDEYQRAV